MIDLRRLDFTNSALKKGTVVKASPFELSINCPQQLEHAIIIIIRKEVAFNAYEELCFSYDLYGNLSAKHLMSMGQLTKEIQVIYDEKNYLFSYIIYHDPSNGSMELIKFESPIKFQ